MRLHLLCKADHISLIRKPTIVLKIKVHTMAYNHREFRVKNKQFDYHHRNYHILAQKIEAHFSLIQSAIFEFVSHITTQQQGRALHRLREYFIVSSGFQMSTITKQMKKSPRKKLEIFILTFSFYSISTHYSITVSIVSDYCITPGKEKKLEES